MHPLVVMDGASAPVPDDAEPAVPPQQEWAAAAEAGLAQRTAAAADEGEAADVVPVSKVQISPALLQSLIDAARAGFPNEACGIVAGDRPARDGGKATAFHALRNAAESPYRYLIDPEEQLRVTLAIDDAEEAVWGIFHSHVGSTAEPSATDVGLAQYPDALYLICSLAGEVPVVRAWSIRNGTVREVALSVG
ncbi:MAG: M67 family metallopeptidase [Chloroflexi bacterium]|nr:M67 family metallopeptidase [Chloroflexota bacterium]